MTRRRETTSTHLRPSDDVRKPRLSVAAKVGAVFSVGLVALGVAFCVTLEPWISGPDEPRAEIDARWSQLRQRVAPQLPAGDPTLLIEAVGALGESTVDSTEGGAKQLDVEVALDEPASRALDHLVRWDRQGDGVGMGECKDQRLLSFELLGLARVAIRSAEGPTDPRFLASLALARSLRDRSGILGWMVGASILTEALERVEAAGWDVPPMFYEDRPLAAEVPIMLARDVVCWEGDFPASLTANSSPEHLGEGELEDFVAWAAFDTERERLYLRSEYGQRLTAALAGEGREHVLEAVRSPPRENDAPSLVVRSVFRNLPELAEMSYKSVEHYDDTLRRVAQRSQ